MNTLLRRAMRASIVCTTMVIASGAFGQRFASIEDLGVGKAYGVNSLGEVCGYTISSGINMGFIYRDRAAQVYDDGSHTTTSEFHQLVAGGPSGTRLAAGFRNVGGGVPDQAMLAVLNPDNSYGGIILGNSDFAPNAYLFDPSLQTSSYPYLFYNNHKSSPPFFEYHGASHAYGVVQASADVPGLDGAGAPTTFDVYYVVGDYEYATGITHAALWRVVIQSDTYAGLSNNTATLFDLHTAGSTIIDGQIFLRDMMPGSSTAKAITLFKTKAQSNRATTCAIGGSLTTDATAPRAAMWLATADTRPEIYRNDDGATLWTPGECRALYCRHENDKLAEPIIGYFGGVSGSNAAVQTNGSAVSLIGAGSLNGVGLSGVDRGEAWAVGTLLGQAELCKPASSSTPTILQGLVPPGQGWASLSEANALYGKAIVGSGTLSADGLVHSYKLSLK